MWVLDLESLHEAKCFQFLYGDQFTLPTPLVNPKGRNPRDMVTSSVAPSDDEKMRLNASPNSCINPLLHSSPRLRLLLPAPTDEDTPYHASLWHICCKGSPYHNVNHQWSLKGPETLNNETHTVHRQMGISFLPTAVNRFRLDDTILFHLCAESRGCLFPLIFHHASFV